MAEPRPSPAKEARMDTPGSEENASDTQSVTAVLESVEALRARVLAAEQERDEFKDKFLRSRADFDNYQKRTSRELAQERRFAHAGLALDLLPVLDNFDRATEAAKQAGETGPLVQGVAMVRAQILDLLRRHGITPIEAAGKSFDPNLHEAVMQKPTAEVPPNTVVGVLEQGFLIHDRVLRPAKVIVSAPMSNQS
jgi:molecular chaperone GrpE